MSVWELGTGQCVVPELGKHKCSVGSIAVSPDGQLVAPADYDALLKRDGVVKM